VIKGTSKKRKRDTSKSIPKKDTKEGGGTLKKKLARAKHMRRMSKRRHQRKQMKMRSLICKLMRGGPKRGMM